MSETVLDPVEIVTERLRLRRLVPADAGLLELYAGDERVARMTERIPHPYPPGMAAGFVDRIVRGVPDEVCWAIDIGDGAENGLIGTIMLRATAPDAARIGYWLAPAFWGAGYGREAAEAVVGFAAGAGFREVTARVFQDNPASTRVLLSAGFAYVDDGEAYSVARGAMVPTHNYRRELGA